MPRPVSGVRPDSWVSSPTLCPHAFHVLTLHPSPLHNHRSVVRVCEFGWLLHSFLWSHTVYMRANTFFCPSLPDLPSVIPSGATHLVTDSSVSPSLWLRTFRTFLPLHPLTCPRTRLLFPTLAIVNTAAMSVRYIYDFELVFSYFLHKYPEEGLPGHILNTPHCSAQRPPRRHPHWLSQRATCAPRCLCGASFYAPAQASSPQPCGRRAILCARHRAFVWMSVVGAQHDPSSPASVTACRSCSPSALKTKQKPRQLCLLAHSCFTDQLSARPHHTWASQERTPGSHAPWWAASLETAHST